MPIGFDRFDIATECSSASTQFAARGPSQSSSNYKLIADTHSTIVTMFAARTRRREIRLRVRRMLRAMKTGPEGREGRNGLMGSTGISNSETCSGCSCGDWANGRES